jgi:flagellar M-ring protein FliF
VEESLNKMRQQLTSFWEETDKKKKIRLGIIVLIVIAVITTLILVLTSTKYEVLYGDLSLRDMGQITTKLDEMGTRWKAGDDQKSILVPIEDKSRVKIELATYGLPKEGYSFMDAFNDSSWTMTDYDKKQRMKLALESELASTISEIDGVHSAKVYLEEKETTNFVLNNDDTKGTASVFIVRSDNRSLSNDKVNAIRNLVAGPISIDPENVTVIDDEGRLLGDQEENDFMITDQFVMKQHLETRINDSIKKFLSNVFGSQNVDVMSSVKINIDSEKTTIVEFAPPIEGNEEGLIRSLEEVEEHMVGGALGGVPGTETNVEDYTMLEDGSSRYDKVSRIINNELNEINKEIRKAPGQVESITVAVLINKDSLSEGEMTPEKQKEITELIFAATGLDTKNVQVSAEKFNRQTDEFADAESKNINWILIGVVSAILIALIVGIVIYMRSKSKESEEQEELERLLLEKSLIQSEVEDLDFEAEESKMKAQIDNFIDKKPESVAQLLRNWLSE